MNKKKTTINEIAQQAGVSKSTVSHVINNTRFVEESTRQKVLKVIRMTGYQPSLIARSLTTKRTETIGVILSDITSQFFIDVLRGVEDVIRPARYSLTVCDTDENLEDEDKYLNLLLRQRVDGIIAAAAHQKWEVFKLAEEMQIPIVVVDRKFEGMEYPFVGADNVKGAEDAARLIMERNHHNIGVISGPTSLSTMADRLKGFQDYLFLNGINLPEQNIVKTATRVDDGKLGVLKLLNLADRPTAFFSNNYFHTLGALLAIREMGLKCPEEIALVGFDDHPWAEVSDPPLTVIRQPGKMMGQQAASILLEMINGKSKPENVPLLPCELVIRKSC